jgi:ubiquinone/menaquinone biosynthesis C-methylase UbiE
MATNPTQDLRSVNYEISQAIASGWERWRAQLEDAVTPVREWMIHALALERDDTVLELAAGAGETGFEAATIVGDQGQLISTDFSPAMLDVAYRRGTELGLTNVLFRVMDAERIELPGNLVDGVLCRFGYMLMSDPAAALSETRRVLRPGGRLALAVWGLAERNPMYSVLAKTLIERGHVPPPDPAAPGPFSMASMAGTRELLERTGFSDVRLEELPLIFRFSDIEEYLGFATDTAGPLALVLQGLSRKERAHVTADLVAAFPGFATNRGYALPGLAIVAVAS